MKEKRFYQLIILVLVILNIGVISFILINQNPAPDNNRRGRNAMRMMDRRLDLTSEQKQQIRHLRQTHFNQVRSVQQQIMQNKKSLFREMKSEQIDQTMIDSLTHQLGQLHEQMESITFHHFRQMRQQLQSSQVDDFDSLIMPIFRKGPHSPGPRRGRN